MTGNHWLYNGSGTSVVFTASGLSLDAGDRTDGNPNSVILSRLIASGQLTDLGPVDEPDPDPEPADDAEDAPDEDIPQTETGG